MKLFILSVTLLSALASAELTGDRITNILDDLLKNYDNRVRPNSGGDPLMVTLSGYAIQVGGFCGKNDDMHVDMYLRQSWNDPRLVLPLRSGEKGENIHLGHTFDTAKIWTPDTFFSNARKGEKMSLLDRNHYVQIDANGDVTLCERVETQAKCGDGSKAWNVGGNRTCALDIESFGLYNNAIDYKWREVETFAIGSTLYPYNVTTFSMTTQTMSISTGNYTLARIHFQIGKLAEKIATLPEEDY